MFEREPFYNNHLSADEVKVLMRVEKYFRSRQMTLRDKLQHAKLIALHDLELGYFATEKEKSKVHHFARVLDHLLSKGDWETPIYQEKHSDN